VRVGPSTIDVHRVLSKRAHTSRLADGRFDITREGDDRAVVAGHGRIYNLNPTK